MKGSLQKAVICNRLNRIESKRYESSEMGENDRFYNKKVFQMNCAERTTVDQGSNEVMQLMKKTSSKKYALYLLESKGDNCYACVSSLIIGTSGPKRD